MRGRDEKIKQSDVGWMRASMLEHEQDNKCALCGTHCDPEESALDHCHTSGRIRGVLHTSCNILLGKVENFTNRYGRRLLTQDRLDGALHNMYWYMKRDYSHNKLHYKHKTPLDKEILKCKRLIKRSKKEATKEKWRQRVKELTSKA